MPTPLRFFVYGSHLSGEPDHGKLAGAELVGPARTEPGYTLVELGALAGLVAEGSGAVVGEVYAAPHEVLSRLAAEHPGLFRLEAVRLEGGASAHAFVLGADQVRGKRRVAGGDWRGRFGARPSGVERPGGALVHWAKARHRR